MRATGSRAASLVVGVGGSFIIPGLSWNKSPKEFIWARGKKVLRNFPLALNF